MDKQKPNKSQERQILDYLRKGYSITPIEALAKFGCFRLGARIWDLKQNGYNIVSDKKKIENGYVAEYSLKR